MKISRKFLAVPVMALALIGNLSLTQASAVSPTYRATNVRYFESFAGQCRAQFVYGQYGTASYAQVRVQKLSDKTAECTASVQVGGVRTGKIALTNAPASADGHSRKVGVWSAWKQSTLPNASVRQVIVTISAYTPNLVSSHASRYTTT